MMETWTTTNHLAILGVMIHWIDDMWNPHEHMFSVEELFESHGGVHMAKVLHEVLINNKLIDKVFFSFLNKFLYLSSLFYLELCTITTDNARKNSTMATNLEKLLKGSSSRFTKNYLRPCRVHVFNMAVQCSWKELNYNESYSDSEDDDKHIEGLEAISQKPFGEILHRLRNLSLQLIILLRGFITIRICVMS